MATVSAQLCWSVLLLGLLCSIPLASAATQEVPAPITIELGTYKVPPGVLGDRPSGLEGYFADLVEIMAVHAPLRFQISYFDSPAALVEALRTGLIEAAGPVDKRPAFEAFASFTEPIGSYPVGIFRAARSAHGHLRYAELAGRRVAVVRESFSWERVRGTLESAELLTYPNALEALVAVESGEADFAVVSLARAAHLINTLRLEEIVLAGYAPFRRQPAFAVPLARDDLRQALQAALDAIPPHEMARVQRKWLTPLELPWFRRPEVVPWLLLVNLLIAAALGSVLWMRHRLIRRSRRLSRTQRMLEHTSRSALVGGWEYEKGGDEVVWTPECHAIHGSQPGSIRTTLEDCLALVDASSRERVRTSIERCLHEGVPFDHVFRLRRADGSEIWAGLSGEPERENGRIVRISGSLRNIDELVRHQIDLERSEKLYRALAHGTSDLVSVHDRSGVFLYASPSALTLTGYTPEELVGRNVDEFRPADRRASFEKVRADIDACKGTRGGKYRFVCKDGSVRWCEYRASILEGSELEGEILLVSRDITERLAAEERFRYLALHDTLTGLPNRIAFSERLSELVGVAGKTGASLAVCFLDVDNFKAINDERGHPVGDQVIQVLAERIKTAAGSDHLVSRLEGDEFAVLIRPPATASVAVATAQRLIDSVAPPIELPDGPVAMTASVGVALFPDDAETSEELLSAADTAMYAAKTDGKNTYRRYDSALGRASLARARALQNVRGALDRGELELFYQPKVRLQDGSVSGLEALLRWRSAEGYRGPQELIEAAEESGAIRRLGRWVLETAAAQMAEWSASGIDVPVAVNVSVRQLHDPGFLGHLRDLVANNPGLAGRLQLEITETAIATDVEAVPALLQQVRDLRIGLHIDDFGSGYSSLSYLGRLPVDTLKIDRSIVTEATGKRDACEVARAIIALGKALGLETVAEGVETPEHASFLGESGCTQAQGYLFARPMPAGEVGRFLRTRSLPRPTEIVQG